MSCLIGKSLQDDALVGVNVLAAGQVPKNLPVKSPAFIQDTLNIRLREAQFSDLISSWIFALYFS